MCTQPTLAVKGTRTTTQESRDGRRLVNRNIRYAAQHLKNQSNSRICLTCIPQPISVELFVIEFLWRFTGGKWWRGTKVFHGVAHPPVVRSRHQQFPKVRQRPFHSMSQLSLDAGKQMAAGGLGVPPCSDGQQEIKPAAFYKRQTNTDTLKNRAGPGRHSHPYKQHQCEWNGHKTWNVEDTAETDIPPRPSVFGVASHRNPRVGSSPCPAVAFGLKVATHMRQTQHWSHMLHRTPMHPESQCCREA